MYRRNVPEHLLPYWPDRHDIHIADDLMMKGDCVLIPKKMRQEMLERVHEGHQGISKCIRRAQQSLWWPGVTQDIREMVERCETCCQFSQAKIEPLICTPLPQRPWQKVAADIFQWRNSQYIVLVDYFSRYIENANLPSLTTATTINRLNSPDLEYQKYLLRTMDLNLLPPNL